jgi:hypothetical protein
MFTIIFILIMNEKTLLRIGSLRYLIYIVSEGMTLTANNFLKKYIEGKKSD